jgi:hypothetical protein
MNARLYRTALVRRFPSPFRTDLGLAADREFLLRVLRATSRRRSVPDVVYRYVVHPGSRTIAGDAAARSRVLAANVRLAEGVLPEVTDDPEAVAALARMRGATLIKLSALSAAGRLPSERRGSARRYLGQALGAPLSTLGGMVDLVVWRGRGSGW